MHPSRRFQILSPALGVEVDYRVLPLEEAIRLGKRAVELSRDDYVRLVLERVIQNLWTDVAFSLRRMERSEARAVLDSLYRGSVMLNPGLDVGAWSEIATAIAPIEIEIHEPAKVTKATLNQMERELHKGIVAQDLAIQELVSALKRAYVGLGDEGRPVGVYLFAGPSGVGKTLLARLTHKHLFGGVPVRIDCGEFQHKHDNQKLLGSPPGYVGYEEGGQLTNGVLSKPDTVVLFDEIEKAHSDMFDTLLRVIDEGVLTDSQGREVKFDRALIILTTNLGMTSGQKIGFGATQFNRQQLEVDVASALKKHFRPEFMNRIDQTIIFNVLTPEDLRKVARLELQGVGVKMARKGFSFRYDEATVLALAQEGLDPIQGVRRLVQARRHEVEGVLTEALLSTRYPKGSQFDLTWDGTDYRVKVRRRATS